MLFCMASHPPREAPTGVNTPNSMHPNAPKCPYSVPHNTLCLLPLLHVGDLMSLLVSTGWTGHSLQQRTCFAALYTPGPITMPEPVKPGHAVGP